MEIINLDKSFNEKHDMGIALGNFDGLHIGHTALIEEMIKESRKRGLKTSLLLFENHTKSIVSKKNPSMLTSNAQKYKLVEEMGIDIIFTLKFTEEIMSLSEESFIKEILIDKINAKFVVVGFDYRFGHKAKGTSKSLKEIGQNYQMDTKIIDAVLIDGEAISSTMIRELIKQGKFDDVTKILGRQYSVIGNVITGDKRGTSMGIPTANLELDRGYALPDNGVYATDTIVSGKIYKSITDIGLNPTFNGDKIKVETHIFNFNDRIYGEDIEIVFKEFMRKDVKFDSKELLIIQMKKDLEYAKNK